MAQRRMFSKSITNSSQFLMMPQSSQNLYFHLGMNADDDGFCEHFTLMRMTESKPDDLKILATKGFVQVFDDKVLIIKHWKENNYLRADRYTASKYLEIYKEELGWLESGIPLGIPAVDTGKVSIGKVSKEEEIIYEGDFFNVNQSSHDRYTKLYPGQNLIQQYRQMGSWLHDNPGKRYKNYKRFVGGWLSRQFKDLKEPQYKKFDKGPIF
ncbi:MAG: hypothetical protein GY861_11840 [bacterium]|nr:hypothetical protein [bacterium]